MAAKQGFTVSGGPVDRNGYRSAEVALSAALTFAMRTPGEVTMYVRDNDGKVQGRVERDVDGGARIFGKQHYR